MRFCTYILLDPRIFGIWNIENIQLEYEPFYIGKGLSERPYAHVKHWELDRKCIKSSKIKAILNQHLAPIVYIYKDKISEEIAIQYEIMLIKLFGRIDSGTGILTNMTNGGEGHSGFKQSNETIEKRMKHLRGKTKSKEIVQNMVQGRLNNSGFKMKESTKEKLRNIKLSEESKQHLREVRATQIIPKEAYKRAAISHYKKILQYDLDGNFVREWDSTKSATLFFNTVKTRIAAVLSGREKRFANFQWKYWQEDYPIKIECYKRKIKEK